MTRNPNSFREALLFSVWPTSSRRLSKPSCHTPAPMSLKLQLTIYSVSLRSLFTGVTGTSPLTLSIPLTDIKLLRSFWFDLCSTFVTLNLPTERTVTSPCRRGRLSLVLLVGFMKCHRLCLQRWHTSRSTTPPTV